VTKVYIGTFLFLIFSLDHSCECTSLPAATILATPIKHSQNKTLNKLLLWIRNYNTSALVLWRSG